MKIKVFEAFAGYGSQSLALERLKQAYPDFDYEVVGISEIDKYAYVVYDVKDTKFEWNSQQSQSKYSLKDCCL
jgi:site-specific DNA-cytosine methylase